MKIYQLKTLSAKEREELCKRPSIDFENVLPSVREILSAVNERGDQAVREYTARFDGVDISKCKVSDEEFKNAEKLCDEKLQRALELAANNITKFHKAQLIEEPVVETQPGVSCFRQRRAIEKVGLYIPGGTAILPSTVLMLAIPARLAGCEKIVLCTPPNKEGKIAPEILIAAKISGASDINKVGGAQAIAAMAYGTNSIPRVDKIFGPGNQYVTAAKMLVASESRVAIDMPAGPSEVLVIADSSADPKFIAADLLSQAEHGVDSQVVFIATVEELVKAVEKEIQIQLQTLPRKEIAEKALENSLIIIAESVDDAISFSNQYAPEHLILNLSDARKYIKKIISAGSVFLGPYSPESVGDYASGTNHTLPTYGYARNYSGVSVDSFVKKITFQELSKDGLKSISETVETIAEAEQLFAHKNAVSIRLKN